jgi:hypothetical protein
MNAALPKWLAWITALIGIVVLIGPIGWAGLIFATPVWTLSVSLLWRRTEARSVAREPALGAAG